jgi:hypothetical protein
LDLLAKVFGLEAWQFLVPNLDPDSPRIVAGSKNATRTEKRRFQERQRPTGEADAKPSRSEPARKAASQKRATRT